MRHQQHGFTVIELMVATTAFAVILLILTSAMVQIGYLYYKGITSSRVQNNARSVMDTVSRPIQFSRNTVTIIPEATSGLRVGAYCIGTQRYTYAINAQVDSNVAFNPATHKARHALWQDNTPTTGCATADLTQVSPSSGGRELLSTGSRLTKFTLANAGAPNLWNIQIGILYGDDDLVRFSDAPTNNTPVGCETGVRGSQWCAFSELSTQINQRLVYNRNTYEA